MKLNHNELSDFRRYLEEQECSRATITKYLHDVGLLVAFCGGELRDKSQLVAFKRDLQNRRYATTSINSMLAAVNRFLSFAGHPDWKLRFLKVQRSTFANGEKELSQGEYQRLVNQARAQGNERLAMLVQTICVTGIRVSETRAITVESLRVGRAEIRSKGKNRVILLPQKLCKELLRYCHGRAIRTGAVFITRGGRPLDRSNIWKMMKRLAQTAGVVLRKVFPHNLRHLFAATYYKRYKDIVRLADILGHSSVDTTRIYTTRSPAEQRERMDSICLLI